MDNSSSPIISVRKMWSEIKGRIYSKFQPDTTACSIFKNMAVLASGTLVARVVGLVTVPVITRIYSPEHLGVLSVFASLTALLIPLGTLRYSAAIPLPKVDGTAANLFALCLISLTAVSVLTGFFLWLFAPILLTKLSIQELLPYWWLLVVAIAGAGLYELLSAWATREKAFKPLAKTKIWQSVLSSMVKVGLGLWGYKPIGLLIGHVISQAGGCTSLSASFYPKLKASLKQISKRRVVFVFKRYSDFLKYRLPSQFLLAFSGSAPLLLSAILFGKKTTGQLGLALTTLALPIALFGNTTGQAYYAEIAKIGRKDPGRILKITKNVAMKLFLVSIPPFLVLLLAGPWLFTVAFGETWLEAGVFSRILAAYLLAQFVSTPIVNALNVFDKQFTFLMLNIIRSIIIVVVFGVSYLYNISAFNTVFIYSVFLSLHYLFTLKTVFSCIEN